MKTLILKLPQEIAQQVIDAITSAEIEEVRLKEPKVDEVWEVKNKPYSKFVVRERHLENMRANPSDYTFVSEKIHENRDFSYTCGSDYCRCTQ